PGTRGHPILEPPSAPARLDCHHPTGLQGVVAQEHRPFLDLASPRQGSLDSSAAHVRAVSLKCQGSQLLGGRNGLAAERWLGCLVVEPCPVRPQEQCADSLKARKGRPECSTTSSQSAAHRGRSKLCSR